MLCCCASTSACNTYMHEGEISSSTHALTRAVLEMINYGLVVCRFDHNSKSKCTYGRVETMLVTLWQTGQTSIQISLKIRPWLVTQYVESVVKTGLEYKLSVCQHCLATPANSNQQILASQHSRYVDLWISPHVQMQCSKWERVEGGNLLACELISLPS